MKNQDLTKIIGFTDKVTDCDCCGKSDLKGTYCVSIDGNEFYYGSTCAANKTGISPKETKAIIKKNDLDEKISDLVKDASNQYLRNKVFKLAEKKGILKIDFLLKYGEIIDELIDAKCYQYGSYNLYIKK